MIFAVCFMLACSQSLYFLFKVRRARVIKYKPQGIYDVFEKNEKKNKTTSVCRLCSFMLRGCYKLIDFLRLLFLVGMIDDLPFIAAK